MKALITAAGRGARMGNLTSTINKCAISVNKIPIIERLVNSLNFLDINDIYVVVGYKSDQIKKILKNKVHYLYNNDFEKTGILDSIAKAKNKLSGKEFIIMTGDSLMHEDIIKSIIDEKGDVVVSIEKKLCDIEDVKALIVNNKFEKISKNLDTKIASGEFTGLVKFNPECSKVFFNIIDQKKIENKLIADVVMNLKDKDYFVKPVYTKGLPRIEVDFDFDLEYAIENFK